MDIVTLALAKNYTKKSLVGVGALKGSPCTIKETRKEHGQTILTFAWKDENGVEYTREVPIDDGTPIYAWSAGNSYKYGDICIYESCFYRCTHANSDSTFVYTNWSAIGNADGNYNIVDTIEQLPARFTSADRKMYYVVQEGAYYLWTGSKWEIQQPKSIKIEDIKELFKDE